MNTRQKQTLHSMEEIDQFMAEGGRITKLELRVSHVPPELDPLDMTVRSFIVRTAESNAAINTVVVTFKDAEEPEAIFLSGLTPAVVKIIKEFSDGLMAEIDDAEDGSCLDDDPICPHCESKNPFPIGRIFVNRWSDVKCRACKERFQVFARSYSRFSSKKLTSSRA